MNHPADDVSLLRYFQSYPQDCSYLDGRQSEMIVADPQARIGARQYSTLINIGFRRSGDSFYRPNCGTCGECKSVRIPAREFNATRSQKRCVNRNRDLKASTVAAEFSDEHVDLYHRYQVWKHDSSLKLDDAAKHMDFLSNQLLQTELVEFRLGDRLVAVSVVDRVEHGLSAVYTYFCPDQHKRGLGNYAVLWLVELCLQQGFPYVYLGYWVESCQKMSYKSQFQPFELWEGGAWHRGSDR